MKSAVFFDIDGTLWNYEHYIPESERIAIRKLRENGHLAFICSGRARAFINAPELLSLGFDGIVCSCGCHVEMDGKILYEKLIDEPLATKAVDTVKRYGFKPILEGPEYLYMDNEDFALDDDYINRLKADMGENLLSIKDNYGKWKINKMSCDTIVSAEEREACFKELEDDFFFIKHNDKVCEIVPKGFSKATGLLKACELIGIDPANTYAFGDGENDLEMLRTAAVGIAMGNGTDRAKATADFVTDAFDNDGIYNGLKHFGLI